MFAQFTIYDIKQSTKNVLESSIDNHVFYFYEALQNANKNVFHGFGILVVWLWKGFGIITKVICTNPDRCKLNFIPLRNRSTQLDEFQRIVNV